MKVSWHVTTLNGATNTPQDNKGFQYT